jgi:hypothetical protein
MNLALQRIIDLQTTSCYLIPDKKDTLNIISSLKKQRRFTVGISKFGKGLFSKEIILKDSLIMNISGRLMKFDEAVLLGEKESYPFQVELFEYIAPDQNDFWQYINHSCEPNCGVNEKLEIIALRDIEKGEELFYDYSTTMLERHWTMQCQCNSKNCRHIISDFDTLITDRQKYYLGKGVVQNFIKKYLNL